MKKLYIFLADFIDSNILKVREIISFLIDIISSKIYAFSS